MVERIILKFAAAGAALLLGLSAPVAATCNDDNVDAASSRYDSPEVIRKISGASRSRTNECFDCQPRRRYDDQKVVKKVRNIDRSRVINTVTVVPVSRHLREINRLVIQKNEIRHVGVVHHNHTIVEKDIRYVRRVPITTTVNFVTHNYRVMERPAAVSIPAVPRRNYECRLGLGRYQGSCGPTLRVRG